MHWVFRLCFCLVLTFLSQTAYPASEEYLNFTNYQTEQGLSSNQVCALDVDGDGFLWIATDYGLNRFDGAVFRCFLHEKYPSLKRNDILQVRSTDDGNVLVSGYNGFFQRYNQGNGKFESIFPESYFGTVSDLYYGYGKQEIYAVASDGLYVRRIGTSTFDKLLLPVGDSSGAVNCITSDASGNRWLLKSGRMLVVDKDGRLTFEAPFPDNRRINNTPILLDLKAGRVLVCRFNRRLEFYKSDATGKVMLEKTIELPFSDLKAVQIASDGSFWFASDGQGLWMSPAEPVSASQIKHVLPYGAVHDELAKIYTLLADDKGNVWVGTQNSGLWKYSVYNRSSAFSSADLGLPRCLMHSFCELPSGVILAACDGVGVCEFSEKSGFLGCATAAQGLDNLNMTGVACDAEGNFWTTAWGGGLYAGSWVNGHCQFRKENFRLKNEPLHTMSNILTLSNGEMWVCVGGEGLYFRNAQGAWNKQELEYPDRKGLYERWPSFCFEGSHGEVWNSSSFAMWTNKDGTFVPFDLSRFLGNDDYVVNDGLNIPGYGVVLATRNGLLVAQPGDSSFSELELCPKKEVFSLVLDKKQRLWAVVANSIWCFDVKANSAKHYPQDFDARGKNFFLKHAKFCSSTGRIYFGTKDGFFSFNSDGFDASGQTADLFLSCLEMDGELVGVPPISMKNGKLTAELETLTLPYGHSSFAVCVDMPDFSTYRPSLVYRLKGEEWISLGRDQRIDYSYLPVGSYLLEVKALGGANESALRMKIEVEGPWWNSWWFRLMVVLGLLALAGWKLYTLNRDKHLLQSMVDERTRELAQKSQLVEHRNMELNAALTTKDRLMAVVAHDLKNPVFAIVGALENLRKRNGLMSETESNSLLDSMIERALILQTELSKLLVWATSNQGEIEFRPSNTDLAEIVNSDVALSCMQAETKGVELISEVDLPFYSYIDGRMISTAIRNVLGNSLKFTNGGKAVSVRAWQEDGKSIVEIKDQGVGMAPDKLAEILAKNVNASTSGTNGEQGTGLGIGLAKYYVDTNGGTFSMESQLGVGSTTRMEFPATKIAVVRSGIAQTKDNMDFVADTDLLDGNTVLVVDDDPLIAQNVKAMLEGYVAVLVAQNGEEALKLAQENNVDIVISDVEMPVMNGIEMSNALASDSDTNHIPVLFLSAKTSESDRLLGLLTGAVDYIPKPFSQSELLIKLNNILALRQRQQQRLLREQLASGGKKTSIGGVPGSEENAEGQNQKMNPFLQKVVDDIKQHYAEADYGVEQMAANLFTTRITLYRKVKSLSGRNPSDMLTDFRLNKAVQLLKEGKLALQDVAFAVGFNDHAYFSRRFKARFGFPPKDVKAD